MFKVCEKPCDQCLFSKSRIVSSSRVKEILKECKDADIHFVCHKATMVGTDVCCRTFFDTRTSQMIRIAERLRMITFVDPSIRPTLRGKSTDPA